MISPDAGQRPVVTFELLVKHRDGTWEGAGTFSSPERDYAVEQAKALEQSADIVSAKVMKETYDPNTDTTQEVSIYRSKNLEVNGEVDAFEARRERLKGAKKSKKKRRSRRWGVKWLSPMALLVALYRALTVPTNSKQTKRVSGFSIKKAALKRSKVKQNKSTVRKNTINRNIDARRWESQKYLQRIFG